MLTLRKRFNCRVGRLVLLSIVALSLTGVTGCSEYWWTRGQPPSVETLIGRSQERLETALTTHAAARSDIAPSARELQQSLLDAVNTIKNGDPADAALARCREHFMALENRLSVGSRAPYGELAGQLRAFANSSQAGTNLEYHSFGLFAARTLFFLANELSVPAPVVG